MLFRSISMATLSESSLTTKSNVSGILISTSEGWETTAEEAKLYVSKAKRNTTCTVTDKRVHMHSENSSRNNKTWAKGEFKTGTNLESKLLDESLARGRLLVGRGPAGWDASCGGASLEDRSS